MPPPKKKPNAAKHAGRFADRAGTRLRTLVDDARQGRYDSNRFADDVSQAVLDVVDFWSSLFGTGASPSVGLADFGPQRQATWKGGLETTVRVADEIPATAVFPVGVLRLAPLGGGAPVALQLQGVNRVDEFELKVSVQDVTPGPGFVAPGQYIAVLHYVDAGANHFATMIQGEVTL